MGQDDRAAPVTDEVSPTRFAETLAGMTDLEVVEESGNLQVTYLRDRAQAEMTRRLIVALDRHREESAASGRRLERLTRWLIGLTVVLVVLTVAVVWLTATLPE